jgi:hypothetical protein
MFEPLTNLTEVLPALLLLVMAIAGYRMGQDCRPQGASRCRGPGGGLGPTPDRPGPGAGGGGAAGLLHRLRSPPGPSIHRHCRHARRPADCRDRAAVDPSAAPPARAAEDCVSSPPRGWARVLKAVSVLAALALIGGASFVYAARLSTLPDRLSMMSHDTVDYGGGPAPMPSMAMEHAEGAHGTISVADLTGDATGTPDATFTLSAEQRPIQLSSGTVIDAWTFNGQLPGPELRVRQGDLEDVTTPYFVGHASGNQPE